uniref:Uncharacterized protein n=1 Tax=Amblyomma cajennense TaxID=34607 RepID=A0A023FCC9_AMBCJ
MHPPFSVSIFFFPISLSLCFMIGTLAYLALPCQLHRKECFFRSRSISTRRPIVTLSRFLVFFLFLLSISLALLPPLSALPFLSRCFDAHSVCSRFNSRPLFLSLVPLSLSSRHVRFFFRSFLYGLF